MIDHDGVMLKNGATWWCVILIGGLAFLRRMRVLSCCSTPRNCAPLLFELKRRLHGAFSHLLFVPPPPPPPPLPPPPTCGGDTRGSSGFSSLVLFALRRIFGALKCTRCVDIGTFSSSCGCEARFFLRFIVCLFLFLSLFSSISILAASLYAARASVVS